MSSVRLAALAALVSCASLWGIASQAQVYRIVGPDGKVTFTDRPPAEAAATPAPTVGLSGGGGGSTSTLPLEVRNAASRFPVTLYTASDCAPCVAARNHLVNRGIPFTERTVSTNEDIKALANLAGEARLPFATIGGQHVNGYSDQEYASYLDAAGYPRKSVLPPNWRNPAPTPLVALQPAPAPATRAAAAPQQEPPRVEPPPPSAPSPANPAGIRF